MSINATEAARWLAYAHSDLAAAQALYDTPDHYPRQVCYFAQQAVEKALKAIFVFHKIEFPLTHDLDRLRALIPEGWSVKQSSVGLTVLTVWAIGARYPDDLPDATIADATAALAVARAAVDSITNEFESRLQSE